jgi:organic radical activating enzyme
VYGEWVWLTGGEPTDHDIEPLCRALKTEGYKVALATAGMKLIPSEECDLWSGYLDFVSVHFYPETGQMQKALTALQVYDVGKPIVVEEMFPLKCSSAELIEFVHRSKGVACGWISFYWGKPIDELDQKTIAGKITADWFKAFQAEAAARVGN